MNSELEKDVEELEDGFWEGGGMGERKHVYDYNMEF